MTRAAAALAVDDGVDLIGAGRLPVSLASAYADLCAALGIAPPAWVMLASA
jgi:hypothetical protein